MTTLLLLLLGCYLIGSVSFSYFFVKKIKGEDLRNFGSGNLGATNAGRVLGQKWAVIIYLCDFAKGFIPTWLARHYLDQDLAGDIPPALLAGLSVILGHIFPFYLQFRGGKGVATGSGVVICLAPLSALISFGVWLLFQRVFRLVALASIFAGWALALSYWVLTAIRESEISPAQNWARGFFVLMALLITATHHSNIRRMIRGEED